jgi:hypothetical protein
MSGDGKDDVNIPMVFLFHKEGEKLKTMLANHPRFKVYIGKEAKRIGRFGTSKHLNLGLFFVQNVCINC